MYFSSLAVGLTVLTAAASLPALSTPPPAFLPFITLVTDADVTWCRPWPNTAYWPANHLKLYRGTVLNLTCWSPTDVPEPDNGPGLSQPWDIWVKSYDTGCWINENDLSAAKVVFEDVLQPCRRKGPWDLGGVGTKGWNGTKTAGSAKPTGVQLPGAVGTTALGGVGPHPGMGGRV
ncbi:hypothetical protein EJ06DRAFT_518822 [Trichodelitschia bisporula]|uniref:Uncharacterized protein n=1 Tax=Trichodelitschia bisporula TaxID=703511 RepID=A0A6G1I8A6_9PEZI|nr:hypothetical protein EJ06DRAFT_518822 [Trichodelitschia bisporula]